MLNEKELIEKIKKLLALAASPNENEAQLAMSKAQELMAKYCINIIEEKDLVITSEIYYTNVKLPFAELIYISNVISRIFGCITIISNVIEMHGYSTNIKIVKFSIDSVLAQASIELKVIIKKEIIL